MIKESSNKMVVHYSSERPDWGTPQDLFDRLNDEFHFDVDVCASDLTAKCEKYYTIETDGLSQKWEGSCFCNPPYGREIPKWIKKAYESSLEGATTVCLIPSRTDTSWWHDYVIGKCAEVRFIRGRLKHVLDGVEGDPAPFPSAIVVFHAIRTKPNQMTIDMMYKLPNQIVDDGVDTDTCVRCNGSGTQSSEGEDFYGNDVTAYENCELCNGSGILNETVSKPEGSQ